MVPATGTRTWSSTGYKCHRRTKNNIKKAGKGDEGRREKGAVEHAGQCTAQCEDCLGGEM